MSVTVGLAALELLLQAEHWLRWRNTGQRPVGPPAADAPILCVGGDVPFGLGLRRDASFPAQLQNALHARGRRWRVVNGADPGRNSEDVLRRLGWQLAELRPRVVIVTVDGADLERPAAAVDRRELPVRAGACPVGWRLPAVIGKLWKSSWSAPTGMDATSPPFVGTWHAGGLEVELAVDGSGRIGLDPIAWQQHGQRLLLHGAAGRYDLQWQMRSGQLEVSGAPLGVLRLRAGAASQSALASAVDALRRRDFDEARWLLEVARHASDAPPQVDAIWRLLEWWERGVGGGDPLRGQLVSAASSDAASGLWQLLVGGRWTDAERRQLARGLGDGAVASALQAWAAPAGSPDAERAAVAAIAAGGQGLPLPPDAWPLAAAVLDAHLTALGVGPSGRATVRTAAAAEREAQGAALAALRSNLSCMVALVRAWGAEVRLAVAPAAPSTVRAVVEEAAGAAGALVFGPPPSDRLWRCPDVWPERVHREVAEHLAAHLEAVR